MLICRGGQGINIEAQNAACTAIITAAPGAELAEAYYQRCHAEYVRYLLREGVAQDDVAIADCSKAVAINPDYAQAFRTRGDVYGSRLDFALAIADYSSLIALRPDYALGFALRGDVYSNKGDYDAAIADYEKAAVLNGSDANKDAPGTNFVQGMVEFGLDRARTAKTAMAGGQKPGDPRAWCDGKALPQEGFAQTLQIRGCTILIESGREKKDDLATDYLNRADAYYFSDEPDKAIADYGKVIALRPGVARVYWMRGTLLALKNKNADAIADFTMAIRFDPKKPGYYGYRGRAYNDAGKFDAAIADFTQVLELTPGDPEALLHRSIALTGKKNYSRALVECRLAIKYSRSSEATEGNNACGNAHLLSGDTKSAIDDYGQALARYPEYAEALYGRGVARLRSGDAVGGQADMAAAIKLKADIAAIEAKAGIKP